MNISTPASSAIDGVSFGFLSSDEIRALSVKRISSATTFDTLLHPIPGGLYDPALGAFLDNPCSTCNLSKFSCPGHCGHIQLPAPVYHPSFMDQCLRLLRAKCMYCHKLKMSRVEVNRFLCKLRLVRYGLLNEAEDLELLQPKKKKVKLQAGEEDIEETESEIGSEEETDSHDIVRRREKFVKEAIRIATERRKQGDKTAEKNEAIASERRQIIKEFLGDITKSRRCTNCRGITPGYRKDRFVKIFRKVHTEKEKNLVAQLGLSYKSPAVILDERKKVAARKEKPEEDEGVADLDISVSEEDEDGELTDADTADGNLLASEAAMTAAKATSKPSDDKGSIYMSAQEVHAALTLLFDEEQDIFALVYGAKGRKKSQPLVSADMFFIFNILVPPTKYRPEGKSNDDAMTEAQDNSLYKNILQACDTIVQISREIHGQIENLIPGRRARGFDDIQQAWVNLQDQVNSLIDRDRSPVQGAAAKKSPEGIKQKLEKKEGLFRKNMMGKRVNFAARSVISPDPNIETNEIGVPPVFAKKLTYPEPVTNHNFYELKEAVMNGPDRWPGATAIENENGQIILLRTKSQDERLALANQLLAPSSTNVNGARNKKVHRHLVNGDMVIMNRQPTLHKPSMMAHRARVLPGEKTIRMHYANCNTYNADFDGDEMNMHFPQNEVARAEATMIADTDHQYLSATAGAPLRGLIQDHLSMGVQMCSRDVFFTREEYHQLLYACLRPENNHTTSGRIETVSPAILLPRQLWTGKQVITSVLKNITPKGEKGLTLTSKTQTRASNWGPGSEEGVVIVQDGDLLTGILDKKQIGPKGGGLVHGVYETYGHTVAGCLLSVLGRLLTKVLHIRAFSCGVEDLVLTPAGEARRMENLKKVDSIGLEIAALTVSLENVKDSNDPELKRRLEDVLRDDSKLEALDTRMKGAGSELSSAIVNACLPSGLIKPFPKNHMQAMTESGAKGSDVNAKLISCNLGQQVLEGRRVPTMVSGKTLPCFKPFEPSIRAGGYIADRFLTGIRPQEYFFHAMAGREGLIDTAVKTSRSGYLQRCLIKGMEGLKVEYDTSVRDSDGSMVQFLYGEDGIDVTKAGSLTNFKFLAENFWPVYNSLGVGAELHMIQSDDATNWNKAALKKVRKTGDISAMDPALSQYPPSRLAGSTSEKFYAAVKKYIDENPDKLIYEKKKAGEDDLSGVEKIKRKHFQAVLDIKYLKSIIEAGEAVGVVAGQSIGEPSTQMTLNTFHLAGHSAKNVTLGIPRLREIVMTASAKIATPTMTLHLIPEIPFEHGQQFAKAISKLSLAEVLDHATVIEKIGKGTAYAQAKTYEIQLNFFPSENYTQEYAITIQDVARTVEQKLLPHLQKTIRKELTAKGEGKGLKKASKTDALPEIGKSAGTVRTAPARDEDDDGVESEGDSDVDSEDGEGDATTSKQRNKRKEVMGYEAPDEEEEEIIERQRRDATPETDEDDEGYSGSPKPIDSDESGDEEEIAVRKLMKGNRESRIKSALTDVTSFKFDDKSGTWCSFSMEYSASTSKVLMLNLVENACRHALIQSIPGLADCVAEQIPDPDSTGGELRKIAVISTEGQNLIAMREYQHIINPHKIFTNDIAAMLRLYGVEACRASIVREMSAVFGGHGIEVDNRHLNLIADVMTRGGGYAAFNRMGMASNVSPFMKMSFETTVGFLRDAVLDGDGDNLKNPSAKIVVGKLSSVGTGAFDVLCPVK